MNSDESAPLSMLDSILHLRSKHKEKSKLKPLLEMVLPTVGQYSYLCGREGGGVWGRDLAVAAIFYVF